MQDGQRVYPVDIFVLHHSMGPDFVDTDDLTIQDWFSDTGKARAYQNGAINPFHEHPSRHGQLSYAQAQFSGSADSSNKYNYKLTDLMVNPWGNVAWHAGDWGINTHSCGLENCGDFQNKVLEERQLMCIADFLRGIDQELIAGGYPQGITVMLHSEIYATACPGRIREQRDTLVDMINNPDVWNAKLFPVALPIHIPVITTKTETRTEPVAFGKITYTDDKLENGVTKLVQQGVNGIKTFTYTVTYTDGKETARHLDSEVITTAPIDEKTAVGTYVAPTTPTDTPIDIENNTLLKKILKLLTDFITKFTSIFK